jgi:hypothetical protein
MMHGHKNIKFLYGVNKIMFTRVPWKSVTFQKYDFRGSVCILRHGGNVCNLIQFLVTPTWDKEAMKWASAGELAAREENIYSPLSPG